MANSFLQKLILVILAGAATALVYEFYCSFIQGSMDAVNPNYRSHEQRQKATPKPTPRRF